MIHAAISRHDAKSTGPLIPAISSIFAEVFGEPPYCEGPDDVVHWLKDLDVQLTRPGFELVLATEDRKPVGFAYGYTMTPDMPRWQKLVEPFMQNFPGSAQVLEQGRMFTLMEFAVLKPWRGRRVGKALHDALLERRDEPLALLTVRPDAERAQAVYATWGWRKVGHRPRAKGPGYDVLVRALKGQARSWA
jgi:ribosomal protein S18 acetylase RimI-like enzyme